MPDMPDQQLKLPAKYVVKLAQENACKQQEFYQIWEFRIFCLSVYDFAGKAHAEQYFRCLFVIFTIFRYSR